jgi:hypothetical protein
MKRLICLPAAVVRSEHRDAVGATGLSYRPHVTAPRRVLFAAPPVDPLTLIVAEALRRKARAEVQRDGLRDAVYEMPVPADRQRECDVQIPSFEDDE